MGQGLRDQQSCLTLSPELKYLLEGYVSVILDEVKVLKIVGNIIGFAQTNKTLITGKSPMSADTSPEAAVFVIFGSAGGLTKRRLVPALYNLFLENHLPENFAILGMGLPPPTP
jgi:hypothetical protein